ncbi:hypothetical protein VZT92_012146 [Zoarces viviparus]|uniref:Uncharacterized protein n=1 Tax=Zoarces viviparus TaxID=48416 RepID=A0AAW1F8J8_ZOAVI
MSHRIITANLQTWNSLTTFSYLQLLGITGRRCRETGPADRQSGNRSVGVLASSGGGVGSSSSSSSSSVGGPADYSHTDTLSRCGRRTAAVDQEGNSYGAAASFN